MRRTERLPSGAAGPSSRSGRRSAPQARSTGHERLAELAGRVGNRAVARRIEGVLPDTHVRRNVTVTYDTYRGANADTPARIDAEYTSARDDAWKLRYVTAKTGPAVARRSNLRDYKAEYTKRWNGLDTNWGIVASRPGNLQRAKTALQTLVDYINETRDKIAEAWDEPRTAYYIRLAHDVAEYLTANQVGPSSPVGGLQPADPETVLYNRYLNNTATDRAAYGVAVTQGLAAGNGVGSFQTKGRTFDVHTRDSPSRRATPRRRSPTSSQPA